MSINPEQIRAARGLLKWSQQDLADKAIISINSVKNIENEISIPRPAMIEKIQSTLERAGLEFGPRSEVKETANLIRIIEGADAYLKIMMDAYHELKNTKEEYILFSNDDRRSPHEIIELHKKFRQAKIPVRHLIEKGNTHILGPLKEYRCIDKKYMGYDAIAVYGNKVALGLNEADYPNYKFKAALLIENPFIAEDYKKKFNFMWDMSEPPKESTTEQLY